MTNALPPLPPTAPTTCFRRVVSLAFGPAPHTLVLAFDDAPEVLRLFDAAPYLDRGVFRALQDAAYFRQARLDPDFGTVEWPDGQDFDPAALYARSIPVG